MDESSLAGIRAKLDRADEHLQALTNELRTFFDSEPHSYLTHVDFDAGSYSVRVTIERSPPVRVSIICGDFVQCLRAALDHLANGLVVRPTRRTQFPIYRDADDFLCRVIIPARRRERGPLTGLDPEGEVFARIESYQPYNRSDGIGSHPLQVLNDLSNMDKHRTILTSVSTHRTDSTRELPDIAFESSDIEYVGQATFIYDQPLETGAEVLRGQFKVTGPDPQVHVHGNLVTDVAFGEGLVTTDGLETVRQAVWGICNTILALLPRRGND